MQKAVLLVFALINWVSVCSQTLGGSSVFNFLKLSNTPQLTALGGINISQLTGDIGLSFHNPALLRPTMHAQVNTVFNSLPGSVKNYFAQGGYYLNKAQTTLAGSINYFGYGTIAQTDASGNVLGDFRPSDYVLQVSAARSYASNWNYGASLKFIYSNYGAYRSSGLALDAGLTYTDSAGLWQAALVLKNMGTQLKAYNGTSKDDLPFDLQLGITKKLAKAPLSFSLSLHQLHRFDIRYNDTAFNNENGYAEGAGKGHFFDKLLRHMVFSTQLFVTDNVELSAGYNYLRRKEMNTGNAGNGLNGFSIGVGILVKKIKIRYARSYYQPNQANNQFGLSISFSKLSL